MYPAFLVWRPPGNSAKIGGGNFYLDQPEIALLLFAQISPDGVERQLQCRQHFV